MNETDSTAIANSQALIPNPTAPVPTNPSIQPSNNPSIHDPAAPLPANPSIQQSINPPLPSPIAPAQARRRRGKVARLPDRVRELVNVMIRDGVPYTDIVKRLADLGYPLNIDNLSRWHAGGHQTWLHEESLLDDQHARLDFAAQVVNKKNSQVIQEASIRIAVLRMYSLLVDFDPAVLKDRIAENPGAYARILNALCKLTSGAINLERLRLDQADD